MPPLERQVIMAPPPGLVVHLRDADNVSLHRSRFFIANCRHWRGVQHLGLALDLPFSVGRGEVFSWGEGDTRRLEPLQQPALCALVVGGLI